MTDKQDAATSADQHAAAALVAVVLVDQRMLYAHVMPYFQARSRRLEGDRADLEETGSNAG